MQAHNVIIGATYQATVSGKRTRVRIGSLDKSGKGWIGTNLTTGHAVRIRTAARLWPLPVTEQGEDAIHAEAIRCVELAERIEHDNDAIHLLERASRLFTAAGDNESAVGAERAANARRHQTN